MQARQALIPILAFLAPLGLLASSNSASAYTIFRAEQSWAGNPWFPWIPFPDGESAESAFVKSLPSPVIIDTLNGLTPGPLAGQSLFGGLARITQSSITYPETDEHWCYNYSPCIERLAGSLTPNPLLSVSFIKPVGSFGFWANHQNSYNNQITVRINGGPVILGPSAITGASSFFGFVASDASEWITSLDFITSNEIQGYLYFDQFSTSEVPGPVPAMAGLTAFGWSRHLRKRIKSCKRVSKS